MQQGPFTLQDILPPSKKFMAVGGGGGWGELAKMILDDGLVRYREQGGEQKQDFWKPFSVCALGGSPSDLPEKLEKGFQKCV